MPATSRVRLTNAAVQAARPRDDRYELVDTSGLALRVGPRGDKQWSWRYRTPAGAQRRLTIGNFPAVSLADARVKLAEAQAALARGHDPAEDRRGETVADLIGDYLRRHVAGLRTAKEETRRLRKEVEPALGHLRVQDVKRRHVADLLAIHAERPTSHNRLRGVLQRLFGRAVAWGWLERNPVDGTEPLPERSTKTKALEGAGLRVALDKLGGYSGPAGAALLVVLLTGCRPGEVAKAKPEDVVGRLWTIPAENAKNGRARVVPLSALAARMMARRFKGGRLAQHTLAQAARRSGIGCTAHDLRRTCRTGLSKLGVPPHVCEAVLGHLPPQLVQIYDRHDYLPEQRVALRRWALCLLKLRRAA